MRPLVRRPAGLLAVALLAALLPAASSPAAHAAAPAPAHPAGIEWARGAAGPGDLPLGWATYLDGSGGNGIAADGQGNVYLTGTTATSHLPVTPGAAQPRLGGSALNAFVASYTPAGRLRWATYLGGPGRNDGLAIAVDGQGRVYVTGSTASHAFPVTPGAAQPHNGSSSRDAAGAGNDAYIAAYDASGKPRWATYLGGKDYDEAAAITIDGRGNVYVAGSTSSPDFPVTPGGTRPHLRGPQCL